MIAASGQLVGIATFHLLVAAYVFSKSRVPADAPPPLQAQARAAGHVWKFLAGLGVLIAVIGFVV